MVETCESDCEQKSLLLESSSDALLSPRIAIMSEAPRKNNPADFLKTVLGRPVVVKLNSGVDYRGAPAASAILSSSHDLTAPPRLVQVCSHAWMAT